MTTPSSGETQTLTLDQAFRHAAQLHGSGNLDAAAKIYQAIIQAVPQQPDANHNLGVIFLQRGNPGQALPLLHTALTASPQNAQFWISYIETLIHAGNLNSAKSALKQAQKNNIQHPALAALHLRMNDKKVTENPYANLISMINQGQYELTKQAAIDFIATSPMDSVAWKILGAAYTHLGDIKNAIEATSKSIEIASQDAETHNNLGVLLYQSGLRNEACSAFAKAIEINSEYADALNNLGGTLIELGRLSEGEAHCRKTLSIEPNHLRALNNLSISLRLQQRYTEALIPAHHAVRLKPDWIDGQITLSAILLDMGAFQDAITQLQQFISIKPDVVQAHSNLGVAFLRLGRLEEATLHLKEAIRLAPDFSGSHNNLGLVCMERGRYDEAVEAFRKSVELDPTNAAAMNNLGFALNEMCLRQEALVAFRQAHELDPADDNSFSNLLFAMSQDETVSEQDLFATQLQYAEIYEKPLRANWPRHPVMPDTECRIKVGFVSADLKNHAVTNFIAPTLRYLSPRNTLELHIYNTGKVSDETTDYLKSFLPNWHSVGGMNNAELSEKIQRDGINILVDLSNHTAGNRLLAFARKPAPIQVSWIGAPGTTGLQAMDYYIADRMLLPPGRFDSQFSESIVYLPASATYAPGVAEIEPSALPALKRGSITFGSFNKSSKINRETIKLWSCALTATPGSRLLMGGIPDGSLRQQLLNWFAEEGIEDHQLTFHPRLSLLDYLCLHHEVDICLDTFPYNGGTTTLNALWMGVPTVTMVGQRIASRTGAGALGHVGLSTFVAESASEYVHIATTWAARLTELAELRTQLRSRLLSSAICQPEVVGSAFERALLYMWERRQNELPAVPFEIGTDTVTPLR